MLVSFFRWVRRSASDPYEPISPTRKRKVIAPRTAAKACFISCFGKLPVDKPARFLEKLSLWLEFSKWCVKRGNGNRRTLLEPYSTEHRYSLYRQVLEACQLAAAPIDYLEFGVYKGESLRWWTEHAQHPDSKFTGFDCFTGLPSDWEDEPAGTFSTKGRPPDILDPRCSFRVGMFGETLPSFIRGFEANRQTVLHMDADIYTSTLFVLITIASKLKSGDILFFDEFGTPTHEFKAFQEFASCTDLKYELMGAVNRFTQVCLKIV